MNLPLLQPSRPVVPADVKLSAALRAAANVCVEVAPAAAP
jgi:hypothetical protein